LEGGDEGGISLDGIRQLSASRPISDVGGEDGNDAAPPWVAGESGNLAE
jgi:hypothetical protein